MLIAVEIDQLEALVAVVRGGGFTRAAAALHLSQPAVSRRLNLLERELGAPLFDRVRSGAVLTEAGKAFLPHAEALLASMRDGVEAVRGLEGADRGAVTLALVGTLASTTLTAALRGFREAHPRIQLRVRTALSDEVSALVRRGDATLGLRYGADPHPDLVSVTVHDEPRLVVCSPRHRLARARTVAPAMLAEDAWIGFPSRPDGLPEPSYTSLRQSLAASGLGDAEIIADRQPHRPEAHGRGRLRAGPPAREQRGRGAPRGHAARPARPGDAGYHSRGHDPPPPRLSERGGARADGDIQDETDAARGDQAAPRAKEIEMSETVGFIGLGTMGLPMLSNLAHKGMALVVHDASPAAAAAASGLPGVTVVSSAAEVAARSDVLFSCLPNNDIVLGAYLEAGGVALGGRPGLITCDCSTVGPEVTVKVAAALKAKGITHMDTPMLGSKPQAVSGDIFFIVGGDETKLARIKPYLEIMGKLNMYVGGTGMANRVKLIHNGLAAVTSVAVAEALAMCVQSGVDPGTFYDVVRQGGGMAFGTYFDRRAKRIFDGDFSPTFMLEHMRKDATLALALAHAVQVPTPMLEETKRTYDEALDSGWGKEDFSAVTHVIEKRINRRLSGK